MNATSITRAVAFAAAFAAAAATAPAALAGEFTPAGEVTVFDMSAHMVSTKTREQRTAETLLARSRDELVYGGIGAYRGNTWLQTAVAKSTKTRAERKAETMEAVKHGQLMPAGDAS